MEEIRFYKEKYPEIDDMVMVKVGDQNEHGFTVYLLEYENIEGFLPITELVKWRMKKKRILTKGHIVPLIVIDIDKNKSYINLSKKKVKDEDIPQFEKKFKYANNLNKMMNEILRMYKSYIDKNSEVKILKDKDELCSCTLWKMFENSEDWKDYENIYNRILKEPKELLNEVSPEFAELAVDNIQNRIIKTWCNMESEFFLLITSDSGIELLKNVLKNIPNKSKSYEVKLKINSPKYTLSVEGEDPEICSDISHKILEQVKKDVGTNGQIRTISTNVITKASSYDLKFLSKKNLENFSF